MIRENIAEFTKGEFAKENKEKELQIEEVVLLLKPGASQYEKRLCAFLTRKNLNMLNRREIVFNKQTLLDFYPGAEEKITKRNPDSDINQIVDEWANYFSEEPVIALLIQGKNAFEITSRLKKRVRGILKLNRPRDGLHSSENAPEAEHEKRVVGFEN